METFSKTLEKFVSQAQEGGLKTSEYPKQFGNLIIKVSFGMGTPAHIPWIAFYSPEMKVSKGYYPVYLYYKKQNRLILSYGVSETNDFGETWPLEVMNDSETIEAHFDEKVARYGNSYVFKSYMIADDPVVFTYTDTGKVATQTDLDQDLETLLNYYEKVVSPSASSLSSFTGQGLFYMEKQLEDFIIENWENTELGQKMDLIIEEGELLSQQYRTGIGPIDILAKDKKTGSYVVIELKKNQTSDDTVGQLTRYMGWIKKEKGDKNVRGVIIAGAYDKKLGYAMEMVPNIEVFLYKVDFNLEEFKQS